MEFHNVATKNKNNNKNNNDNSSSNINITIFIIIKYLQYSPHFYDSIFSFQSVIRCSVFVILCIILLLYSLLL